jgi:hypothetical protein
MHDNSSNCDLKDKLAVQLQWWNGSSWATIYDADVKYLFAAWQKVADNMPAGATLSYQLQVKLDLNAGNELQGKTTNAWVLIHAVQYNGPAPVSPAPWEAKVPAD